MVVVVPNKPMGFSGSKNDQHLGGWNGGNHHLRKHPCAIITPSSWMLLWTALARKRVVPAVPSTSLDRLMEGSVRVVLVGQTSRRRFLVGFPVNQNVVSISVLKKKKHFGIAIYYLRLLTMPKSPWFWRSETYKTTLFKSSRFSFDCPPHLVRSWVDPSNFLGQKTENWQPDFSHPFSCLAWRLGYELSILQWQRH